MLTIFTKTYGKEMLKFFLQGQDGEVTVVQSGSAGGNYFFCVENSPAVRQRLQQLMEHIILCDNTALMDSEKVFNSVAKLAFEPNRGVMRMELDEFLEETGAINIEGYIRFRLKEYSERINSILYSLVKKNLCRL